MHVLFKSILYFFKFYIIEHIMYFVFNNNIYIYIDEKCNFIKTFKLQIYNIFYIKEEDVIKMNFFF